MRVEGVVRRFDPDEGWGVIDSAATPGGCFAGFSAIRMAGYRTLTAGQPVFFEFERADQDGCQYAATAVYLTDDPTQPTDEQGESPAYRSRLDL